MRTAEYLRGRASDCFKIPACYWILFGGCFRCSSAAREIPSLCGGQLFLASLRGARPLAARPYFGNAPAISYACVGAQFADDTFPRTGQARGIWRNDGTHTHLALRAFDALCAAFKLRFPRGAALRHKPARRRSLISPTIARARARVCVCKRECVWGKKR